MENKNGQQYMAELEYFFGKYFDAHIAPIADKAVKDADAAFQEEYGKMIKDSGTLGAVNFGGTMSLATLGRMQSLDSYRSYWSNIQKSFQKRFDASPDFRNDLGNLITAYQKTMIAYMGKEKYQAESAKYGEDFATWYVNNKLLERSLNRMASHGAPKDAVEYLFQKGSQLSLLGLGQPSDWDGMRTLQEKQYNPSKTEKAAAYGVAGLMDFAIMPVGGMKTAVVATAASAGLDIVFFSKGSQQSIDSLASKSLFGNGYALSETRKIIVDANESSFLSSLNDGMKKKVKMVSPSPLVKDALKVNDYPWNTTIAPRFMDRPDDIPSIVAPGKEEAYKKEQENLKKKPAAKTGESHEQPVQPQPSETASYQPSSAAYNQQTNGVYEQPYRNNTAVNSGWGGFLDQFGLSGFSDVFKNLGYVLAILPDMIIGMFTGKTKSLSIQNNLMPIAAIVMGMFVRNPLLKMLLIGLGGANLLNKATHEALGEPVRSKNPQYRHYADEALNARLSHPQLNGNLLVVSIDGLPCTVTLQDHVVDAYRKGALPLNTLANAVLARYDEQYQRAEQIYDRQQAQTEDQNQQLVIK